MKSILIVEDNDMMRNFLTNLLSKEFNVNKFYIIYGDEPFIDIELMQKTLKQMNESKTTIND